MQLRQRYKQLVNEGCRRDLSIEQRQYVRQQLKEVRRQLKQSTCKRETVKMTTTIKANNQQFRAFIQMIFPPIVKIDISEDDRQWMKAVEDCLEAATNGCKGSLIELLFTFEQDGSRYEDTPWVARTVTRDSWTRECQEQLFRLWDYNWDTLGDTVNEVYCEVNDLI